MGYQTFILIKTIFIWYQFKPTGYCFPLSSKERVPRLETKVGVEADVVLTWPVCFLVRGINGGLIHSESFMPLWQRLYILSGGLRWQQLRSKEIFLSSFSPPLLLLFSLSVQHLHKFLPLSPSLSFPLSDLYRHGLQRFGWGIFRYAFSHTHTHIVCLCAACGAD